MKRLMCAAMAAIAMGATGIVIPPQREEPTPPEPRPYPYDYPPELAVAKSTNAVTIVLNPYIFTPTLDTNAVWVVEQSANLTTWWPLNRKVPGDRCFFRVRKITKGAAK